MSFLKKYEVDDVLFEKRTPWCLPKKLRRIKPVIVGKEFPSKVSLLSEGSSTQDAGEEGTTSTESKVDECFRKPPIAFWRMADCNDIEAISDLVRRSDHVVDDIFNQPDIPDLIEKSTFPLVQFNTNEEMVSFTCAFSYPNIPAVPSFDWFNWFGSVYQVEDITPRNCFFIHYMIWRTDYYADFLGVTLETMFMEFPFLKNVIIIRPPLIKIPEIFVEYFLPVLPKNIHKYNWKSNSVQTMLISLRHSLLDRLKIRLAVVEDHDDLMPIIERQTHKLRELYGDFCMAEIIEYPGTEDRKTLVCEYNGYAVAFMNVNRAIDLDLLNTQFDLGVFHGLRKPNDADRDAEELVDAEETTVYVPANLKPSFDLINSETMMQMFKWKAVMCPSKAEEETSSSDTSEDSNGLPASVVELIRDSTNVNIKPDFSVHALGSSASDTQSRYVASEYGEAEGTIRTDLSLISLQYYNLPEYHGASNAFCIELFAVHEDFNEKLCTDFLEAAFELFPDLEYCCLTIPSQCPVFPLLDMFVRVTPRPLKRFKQELYVCHKSSVMITFMRVRRAFKSDLREIYDLLKGINKREIIFADIAKSCLYHDSAYQGFVLVCDEHIVGVAVVCNDNGMEYLTEHYRVCDLIDFELHKIDYHAILKHLALSPIYQTHARFFLRDVMRMADVTALYRARYDENDYSQASLITVLGQFVPVKPRRMIKYHEPSLGANLPPSYLLNYELPFALYHINSRICGFTKFASNTNVVVVGASRTAYAFLEYLLYAPNSAYVTYNNITWVSPHGTGSELAPHSARDLMFPYLGKYDRRYTAQICLFAFVNFIYGVMTEINRTEKYITINDNAILRYDYLILLCGRQYLVPVPMVREPDMTRCGRASRPRCFLFKYLKLPKSPEAFQEADDASDRPANVFVVNSVVDATNAIINLQYMMRKRRDVETDEKIIIYGQDLIVYLCIQSLIKFGVSPRMIVLVEPNPKNFDSEKVFMDPNVDAAVADILRDLSVTHYRGYVLYDYTLCGNNQVDTATFFSKHQKITLRCLAMFPYEEKLVSDVTFKAVNEASLVYDGRLVINNKFQTNDPFIYSAGPFTKYQRKYYAKDKNHEFFDSAEIGKLLAEEIRGQIDPTEEVDESEGKDDMVPELKRPIIVHGQLPGDWNYFHVRNPGRPVPMEAHCNIKEYGDEMITGDCRMSNGYGYFRLHLDDFGFVRQITCFTKDEIDVENLPMLYGKHEKYLNNLLARYDLGLITDFFAYFRQPWVYALYHDRFKYVMENNEKFFESEVPNESQRFRIVDMVEDALRESNWEKLEEDKMNEIKEAFQNSDVRERITRNLVDYLTTFERAFPMYASPGVLRVLLHDTTTSLLHKSANADGNADYKSAIKISEMDYQF